MRYTKIEVIRKTRALNEYTLLCYYKYYCIIMKDRGKKGK